MNVEESSCGTTQGTILPSSWRDWG